MRERIAIGICLLALSLSAALSGLFAWRHNYGLSPTSPGISANEIAAKSTNLSSATPPTQPGRIVFEQQKCTTCHSIAGTGNPRYPLDAVGKELSKDDLKHWVTGTGIATNRLSVTIIRRKAHYQSLPELEMNSLVDYLSTLNAQAHSTDVP